MSKSINPMFFLRSGTKQVRLRPGFHRLDEFATGYSLAGCTPAEPASASPIVFHLRAEARYLSTVSWRTIAGLQVIGRDRIPTSGGANLDERDGATPDERTHKANDAGYRRGRSLNRLVLFWTDSEETHSLQLKRTPQGFRQTCPLRPAGDTAACDAVGANPSGSTSHPYRKISKIALTTGCMRGHYRRTAKVGFSKPPLSRGESACNRTAPAI